MKQPRTQAGAPIVPPRPSGAGRPPAELSGSEHGSAGSAGPTAQSVSATPDELGRPAIESERRFGRTSLVIALLVVGVVFGITLAPVAAPVILGGLLASFTSPWRDRVLHVVRQRTLAAALVTLLTVLVVLVPVTLLLGLSLNRLMALLEGDSPLIAFFQSGGGLQQLLDGHPQLRRLIPAQLGDEIGAAFRWVAVTVPQVLSSVARSVLGFFITIITLFYLLRDGGWLFRRLQAALPLEPRHSRAILGEFERVAQAFIVGTLGTALVQGCAGGIAYLALGLPEPLLLGALTALTSLVPVVGSSVVWGPLAIYLLLLGETSRAIALVACGVAVVGTVDNFVRPMLTRGGLAVHPLLMFLGLFGGLAVFGLSGLYLGPLVVALFTAVANIYEQEIAPAGARAPINEDTEATALQRAARSVRRGLSRKR